MHRLLLVATAVAFSATAAQAEVPKVVVTIKPLHSLVAAVMGDLGTPMLLVEGAASPHTYSLTPSDAAALQEADIVFWTGHGMELFLEDSLGTLAPNAQSVALSQAPSLFTLPVRGAPFFEHEEHEGEGHEHGAEQVDMHYWL